MDDVRQIVAEHQKERINVFNVLGLGEGGYFHHPSAD
jgi:hypothetical protein